MLTTQERHIRLQGAFNVRDLGGYKTACGGTTRWRSVLRADALHELSPGDVETLLSLGLRTVIDLRNAVELARQPSVFADRDEVSYHHIPLFDGLAPVDVLFREAGLIDLSQRYIDAADNCRPALLSIAMRIAKADEGIVLFNCTAGKDRTGIVAAMLLSIAGVASEEIAADYALTGEIAAALMEHLKRAAVARGLEGEMATRLLSSEHASMIAFLDHIETRYTGFRNYLSAGDRDFLPLIEKRMLVKDADSIL